MSKKQISRRDFLRVTGLAGISLPVAKVVGREGDYDLITSQEEYGSFLIRKRSSGNPPYDVDDSIYERFNARNNGFCRALWDEEFGGEIFSAYRSPTDILQENEQGYRREEFVLHTAAKAFYNANDTRFAVGGSGKHAGYFSLESYYDGMESFIDLGKWEPEDLNPSEVAGIVKKAALFYGASLVGIAEVDQRWIYTGYFDDYFASHEGNIEISDTVNKAEYLEDGTLVFPSSLNRVIVMALEQDLEGINSSPNAIGQATTSNGYARMAFTGASMAEFIRGLGYKALPCGNATTLSVPMAIDAGLGELGRNGLLITPKYGPNVRIVKVLTDMPLETDQTISFGVTEFCEVCGKCADSCPSGALPTGERTREANDICNNPGTLKWPIDAGACYKFMAELGGGACSNCVRSCPFTKPQGWLHEATRLLISGESKAIDKILLRLDDASGYGEQIDPDQFWNSDNFLHVKS